MASNRKLLLMDDGSNQDFLGCYDIHWKNSHNQACESSTIRKLQTPYIETSLFENLNGIGFDHVIPETRVLEHHAYGFWLPAHRCLLSGCGGRSFRKIVG
ncbi:MAG: hypothetical protein VW543_17275, partial [Deltaproteobacteria bacterium]